MLLLLVGHEVGDLGQFLFDSRRMIERFLRDQDRKNSETRESFRAPTTSLLEAPQPGQPSIPTSIPRAPGIPTPSRPSERNLSIPTPSRPFASRTARNRGCFPSRRGRTAAHTSARSSPTPRPETMGLIPLLVFHITRPTLAGYYNRGCAITKLRQARPTFHPLKLHEARTLSSQWILIWRTSSRNP